MLKKDGKPIPQMLLESLEKDIHALKIYMEMSETYQELYARQIHDRQFGDSMRERIERTMKDIHKFGAEKKK